MTETDTPTIEQIEQAEYLALQGMAKAAGLRASGSAQSIRVELLAYYHQEPEDEAPADDPAPEEAPEEPGAPETASEAPETDDGPVAWRATAHLMTRDGKRTIRPGDVFMAREGDPLTLHADRVIPEGLSPEQAEALAKLQQQYGGS